MKGRHGLRNGPRTTDHRQLNNEATDVVENRGSRSEKMKNEPTEGRSQEQEVRVGFGLVPKTLLLLSVDLLSRKVIENNDRKLIPLAYCRSRLERGDEAGGGEEIEGQRVFAFDFRLSTVDSFQPTVDSFQLSTFNL
jgi:hypothetical protein